MKLMKSASSRRTQPPSASNHGGRSLAWKDKHEAAEVVEACQKDDPAAQLRLYEVSHQTCIG